MAGEVDRCPTSSSNTVGSVRTRIPRSRQARTTSIRSRPGADGIAMMTSSGSASSRICGSSRVVPAHAHAVDAQALLERVVVDEADRVQAELRVARQLLADLAPALAGADDQHARARRGASAGPAGGGR